MTHRTAVRTDVLADAPAPLPPPFRQSKDEKSRDIKSVHPSLTPSHTTNDCASTSAVPTSRFQAWNPCTLSRERESLPCPCPLKRSSSLSHPETVWVRETEQSAAQVNLHPFHTTDAPSSPSSRHAGRHFCRHLQQQTPVCNARGYCAVTCITPDAAHAFAVIDGRGCGLGGARTSSW